MPSTNINIHTDSEIKEKAQAILEDLGIDIPTAVNIFLRQIIYREAIPFEISKGIRKTTEKVEIFEEKGKPVKFGGWEGKIFMTDDFNAPLDDFEEYM